MGATRNAVLSVAAAGLLIVGLLVLIPEPARAVIVTPTAYSSQAANGDFIVTANVEIPAEEHIPIVSANVRVGQTFDDGTDLVGTTGGCNAETGGTPSATIISITGATGSFGGPADFTGYGYGINVNQYGYSLSDVGGGNADFSGYDSGTGYGYGYGTPDQADTLTVKVLVSGCAFSYSANVYRALLQVGVGAPTNAAKIYSAPIEVSFVNPLFDTTSLPALASGTTLTGTGSTSGNFASFQFDMPMTGNLAAGSTVNLNLGTLLGGAQSGNLLVITAGQQIPAGSSFTLTFLDVVTDPTMNNNNNFLTSPPFGILSFNGLASTAPLVFFTLNLNIPGQLDPDENAFIASFVISVDVPLAEVPGGLAATGSMRLFGFHSSTGANHGTYIPTVDCTLSGSTVCRFTFTVTELSSFAMSIGLAGGGGGGGAATTTTTSGTSTGTQTGTQTGTGTDTQTGTGTDTQTGTGTGTSTSKGPGRGGRAPGLEFGLLVAALAGIALLARRRLK